jgi:hypothetical protein
LSRDLQLKKGGRLFIKEWDGEESDFVEQEVDVEEFAFHFYDSICLDKDIKLRDVFLMAKQNLAACSMSVGCPFLDDLIDEALATPKKNKNKSGMVALRLAWSVFIEEEDEGESILDHISFHGIGDKEYALEFTPLNELALYPLIIDEDYVVYDSREDEKIHLSTKKKFTLIDLLRGIIDELSYMGPPDIREFALAELQKSAEKDKDGMPKLFTHEELERRLKEKMEKNKKPCRICGEDARSPDFGKPDDICPRCYKNIKEN